MTTKVTMTTTKGDINLTLFDKECPVTVSSFVNLIRQSYYNNLSFHRVIDEFMVQGGCPFGNGMGGPGYQFQDECHPELKHDKPGVLSMANSGPGTNGSQFFITHVATPWLDGKHTVFGAVVSQEDQDVVNNIQQGDKIVSLSVDGDIDAIIEANSDQVEAWNKVLEEEFPHLTEKA